MGRQSTRHCEYLKNPFVFTAGGGLKQRLLQNRWLQIYVGEFGGFTVQTGTESPTGTTTTNTPDTTNPGTYSTSELNIGATKVSVDPLLFLGAKIGSEIYLRWFPHLALGFATGIVTSVGGSTTSKSSSTSTSYNVTNGSPGAKTTSTSSSSSTVRPGFQSNTFGVGGTSFSITGLFTLRYVW